MLIYINGLHESGNNNESIKTQNRTIKGVF